MTILIKTAAAATKDVKMISGSIVATSLAPTEIINIQTSADGITFENVMLDGIPLQLTALNNTFAIYAPISIRIVKQITIGVVVVSSFTASEI